MADRWKNMWDSILCIIWPERNSFSKEQDEALGAKLKNLNWNEEVGEDLDSLEQREKRAAARKDSLAATVFQGRPQNPFSEKS